MDISHILTRKKLWMWLAGILLFLVVLLMQFKLQDYAFDDAYIHFRIARNFIEHGVPYYNPGERVMASTSTGWILIVTALFLIDQTPFVIVLFNAVCTVAGAWIFSLALSESKYRYLYGLLYISLVIPSSIGLMETPFTMLIFGLAYWFYKNANPISLILFGVIPFLRPEFIIISGTFILWAIKSNRFNLKQSLVLPIIGALPFLVFDLVFYHTVIPNSILAKLSGYNLSFADTIRWIISYFVPGVNFTNIYFWILLAPFVAIETYKARINITREECLMIFSGILLVIAYIAGRILLFPWYGPLFTIPVIIPAAKALISNKRLISSIALMVMITPLVFSLGKTIFSAMDRPQLYPYYYTDARTPLYIDLGKELYEKYPKAGILTSEIGGLGWGYRGYIFDGFGLVSPEAIKYQTEADSIGGSIPLELIKENNPEIIVSHEKYIRSFFADDVSKLYINQPEQILLSEDEGNNIGIEINVFIRRDIFYLDNVQ